MATEIERKFLVTSLAFKEGSSGEVFRQGYLSTHKERTVRVRLQGSMGKLTIKGLSVGASRSEFEYDIPTADAEQLLVLCEKPLIEKTRYKVKQGSHTWEIDEFHGDNAGLIVAEIELSAEDEAFDKPRWVGQEVTDDRRYFNSNLIANPYKTWASK